MKIALRTAMALFGLVGAIAPTSSFAGAAVEVVAEPNPSAADAPVTLTVRGLAPHATVRLEASRSRFNYPMRSRAVFTANAAGELNRIDPARLFWSMQPAQPSQPFNFKPGDEVTAFDVRLTVYEASRAVAASTLHRYVVAPSLVHAEINRAGLIAAYFAPRGGKNLPAVIVLNGSDGGLSRDTAAVIAGHGFCTLVVAYFGIGDLPKYLGDIPLEAVVRARNFLATKPEVDKDRIGVVGFSKGAELALVAASRYQWIKAVVAYAPASAVFAGITPQNVRESSWTFGGKPLPFANGEIPPALEQKIDREFRQHLPVSFAPEYLARLNGAAPSTRIAVEHIHGPVMLVAGGDDKLWPSPIMARQIIDRLRAHHHPYPDALLLYPKAGHSIDYPFGPSGLTVAFGTLLLGGTPEANAQADIDSWPRAIAFLKEALK